MSTMFSSVGIKMLSFLPASKLRGMAKDAVSYENVFKHICEFSKEKLPSEENEKKKLEKSMHDMISIVYKGLSEHATKYVLFIAKTYFPFGQGPLSKAINQLIVTKDCKEKLVMTLNTPEIREELNEKLENMDLDMKRGVAVFVSKVCEQIIKNMPDHMLKEAALILAE